MQSISEPPLSPSSLRNCRIYQICQTLLLLCLCTSLRSLSSFKILLRSAQSTWTGRDGTGPDNWASIPKLDSRFDPPLSSSPEILYDEVLLVFLCSSLLARNSHSRRSCLLCLPSSALPPFLHLVPPPIHFGAAAAAAAAAAKWNKSGSFLFRLKERPPSDRGWYGIQQRPRCKTTGLIFFLLDGEICCK